MMEDILQQDWNCPFCQRAQVVTDSTFDHHVVPLAIGGSAYGKVCFQLSAVRCANSSCNEVWLHGGLHRWDHYNRAGSAPEPVDPAIQEAVLRPSAKGKPQPNYIPEPLRRDYEEACAIRDLSPKASATLSRRCLQGMIRDFCGISLPTLAREIGELKKRVDANGAPKGVEAETMDAIDAVRSIGNIGAHMESDINVIVDVETGEAQALIELIELLFEDWYIAKHKRQERLGAITAIAAEKKGLKEAAKQIEGTVPS